VELEESESESEGRSVKSMFGYDPPFVVNVRKVEQDVEGQSTGHLGQRGWTVSEPAFAFICQEGITSRRKRAARWSVG
jgi:hypothetical protein